MTATADDLEPGAGIVNADFSGTGALIAATAVGVLAPDSLGVVTLVVSCALFALGTGSLLWAFAIGVSRSREEVVTLPGLFFASGSAPRHVAFRLRIVLAVQVVAAVAGASIRPFTSVAFGVLAPMFGLGLMGLWSAKHGAFARRVAGTPREP